MKSIEIHPIVVALIFALAGVFPGAVISIRWANTVFFTTKVFGVIHTASIEYAFLLLSACLLASIPLAAWLIAEDQSVAAIRKATRRICEVFFSAVCITSLLIGSFFMVFHKFSFTPDYWLPFFYFRVVAAVALICLPVLPLVATLVYGITRRKHIQHPR